MDFDDDYREMLRRSLGEGGSDEREWADYGKALGVGTLGVVGALGGSLPEYLFGTDETQWPARVREWTSAWADELVGSMSDQGLRDLGAAFLPMDGEGNDIWDDDVSIKGALALKTVAAIPSVAASLAAAVVGGPIAGSVAAGGISAGYVYDEIQEAIRNAPPEELMESAFYRTLIQGGLDPEEAREELLQESVGFKPLLAGGVTAITARLFGVEGRVGAGANVGRARNALRSGRGEMAQEGSDELFQSGLAQTAEREALGRPYDPYAIANQIIEGAAIGGVMGGGIGAATGGRRDRASVPADVQAALDAQNTLTQSITTTANLADPEPTPVAANDVDPAVTPAVAAAAQAQQQAQPSAEQVAQAVVASVQAQQAQQQAQAPQAPQDPLAQAQAGLEQAGARPAQPAPTPAPIESDPTLGVDPDADLRGDTAGDLPPVSGERIVGGTPTVDPAVAALGEEQVTQEVTPPVEEAPPETKAEAVKKKSRARSKKPNKDEAPAQEAAPEENPLFAAIAKQKAEAEARIKAAQEELAAQQEPALVNETKPEPETKLALAGAEQAKAPEAKKPVVPTGRVLAATKRDAKEKDAAAKAQWDRQVQENAARAGVIESVPDEVANEDTRQRRGREKAAKTQAEDAKAGPIVARHVRTPEEATAQDRRKQGAFRDALIARLQNMVKDAEEAGVKIPLRRGANVGHDLGLLADAKKLLSMHKRKPVTIAQMNEFITRELEARARLEKEKSEKYEVGKVDIAEVSGSTLASRSAGEKTHGNAARDLVAAGLASEGSQESEAAARIDAEREAQIRAEEEQEVAERAAARAALAAAPDAYTAGGYTGRPNRLVVEKTVKGRRKLGLGPKGAAVVSLKPRVTQEVTKPATPTPAQAEAGNYAKPKRAVGGLTVTIETAKGQTRKGVAPDGKPWSVTMPADYGYVNRTEGADGDQVDVYLGPRAAAPDAQMVYVVDQKNLSDGSFDEHKVLIGFPDAAAARATYVAGFSDGRGAARIGAITEMTFDQFKEWVRSPAAKTETVQEVTTEAAQETKLPKGHKLTTITQNADGSWRAIVSRMKPFKTFEATGATRGEAIAAAVTASKPQTLARERDGFTDSEAEILSALGRGAFPETNTGRTISTEKGTGTVLETMPLASVLAKLPFDSLVKRFGSGAWNAHIMRLARDRITEIAGKVEIHVVSKADMEKLEGSSWGYYDANAGHIVISQDVLGDSALFEHVVLHEATHAAYHSLLESRPALKAQIRRLMEQVSQDGLSEFGRYGFTNEHEFLAEALANPEFQEHLSKTRMPLQLALDLGMNDFRRFSLWNAVVDLFRRALRIPEGGFTILEGMLSVTDRLNALRSGADADFFFDNWTEAQDGRTPQQGPLPRMRADFKGATALAVSDQAKGLGGWFVRHGYKWATLDNIRQVGARYFQDGDKNPLQDLVAALQKITPYAANLRKRGEGLAQKFAVYQQARPEEARKWAATAIDATFNNVTVVNDPNWTRRQLEERNKHLGWGWANKTGKSDKAATVQSRHHMQRIQEEFMQLSPEGRALWEEMSAFFRETQNDITRALVKNILDTHVDSDGNPVLSPQQRSDIAAKTLSGTLAEGDMAVIKNETIYKALRDARELRSIEGTYVPLMRHGNHVVTATSKIDTMGGREVEPDVIEWVADTDAAARNMFNHFAKKTDLTITGVGKVYYDRKTGAPLKAEDARRLQDHEIRVAYRARVPRKEVMFFDTRAQAEAFRREHGKDYASISEVMDKADNARNHELSSTQLASIMHSINARASLSEGQREQMKTALYQASVRLMSGNRVQHRSLARNRISGASHDITRNTLNYAEATSTYLGKMRFMPEVRTHMARLRKLAGDLQHAEGAASRTRILNELDNRITKNVEQLQEPNKIVQDVMTMSFLDKLFSPAYSVINFTQVMMVTYPRLAGRYGEGSTVAAMTKAYKDIGVGGALGLGIMNTARAVQQAAKISLDTTNVLASVRRNLRGNDAAELNALLDMMKERGLIDDQAGFELAPALSQGRGAWGKGLSKVDRIARQLPIAVETINRSVAGITAYRLARAAGKSAEQARQLAFDEVMVSQGDYSAVNAPTFFNTPWLRPALQFKKYAQLMSFVLVDMTRRMGSSDKQEQRIAFRQLMNVVGVQVMMAGALSLPGLELVKAGAMAAAALGIGDGWDEIERKLRALFDDSLGKEWGELVSRGVVSRALGVDLSTRLSLADLWLFGEPRGGDRQDTQAYLTQFAIGAPGSLLLDWLDAARHAGNGDWQKAAELTIPVKFIADTQKAIRQYNNREINAKDAVVQSIGLRPSVMAERGEQTRGRIADVERRNQERSRLQRAYLEARTSAERARLGREIRAFNAHPDTTLRQKLFPAALDRIRTSREREKEAYLRGN
jgi:hypothetical protein